MSSMNPPVIPNVIILCGGAGTRLQTVFQGKQKVLAEVKGAPVLGVLIDDLVRNGFRRIILAAGMYADQVRAYVAREHADREIVISEEPEPLGTGGAVKYAERHVVSDEFLVMNGDAFLRSIDYEAARSFHAGVGALVSVVAVPPRTEPDYSAVEIAEDGRISSFCEKSGVGGLMNAGVYWMKKRAFEEMPTGSFSLEKDFFPRLVGSGQLYGFKSEGEVHDIGTPERYARANA